MTITPTENTTTTTEVLIIGAGMAGLSAGNALKQAGVTVQLVDKGRGVGGRLSTRRFANGAWFDHGAQYFTANTLAFDQVVQAWEAKGVVRSWFERLTWFEGETITQEPPQNPPRKRYIPTGSGMNSLPKHLATNLPIQTSCRIVRLNHKNNAWEAVDEHGNTFHANALIITSPVPQTLELLQNSHLPLTHQQAAQLNSVMYEPCLAVMLALKPNLISTEYLNTLAVGYKAKDPEQAVAWVGTNHTKADDTPLLPIAFTLHASVGFSLAYWDSTLETVLPLLLEALPAPLKTVITAQTIDVAQLHRWKYALSSQSLEAMPTVCLEGMPPCYLAGDAFGYYAKIETAYLSGIASSQAVLKQLNRDAS
jgi:predicted NAD/FAD-dependent oxidoreductase